MLDSVNLNGVSQDTSKQIASLKTYIQNLKNQIDDELNSISYEQLDSNLKKRIDGLEDSIGMATEVSSLTAQTLKAKYLTADYINTTYMTASEIKASYITADEISASYITADEISSNYLTAEQIVASYATIGSLNAVSGRVGTIEANYISASTVSAGYATIDNLNAAVGRIGTIESNYVKSSQITADYINSKFSGNTGLQASRIYCDNYHVNAEGQSYVLTPRRLVVGSNSLIILGA